MEHHDKTQRLSEETQHIEDAECSRDTISEDTEEHNYVCLNCNHPLFLNPRDSIKCGNCGYRILLKIDSTYKTPNRILAR